MGDTVRTAKWNATGYGLLVAFRLLNHAPVATREETERAEECYVRIKPFVRDLRPKFDEITRLDLADETHRDRLLDLDQSGSQVITLSPGAWEFLKRALAQHKDVAAFGPSYARLLKSIEDVVIGDSPLQKEPTP